MRLQFSHLSRLWITLCGLLAILPASAEDSISRPNVLFIAVDDLRPELGCYGAPAHTPNIDRLASQGLIFDHHYVQVAVCIPSRAALLTGLRPERTHQTYSESVWPDIPNVQSWGSTFREAGYTAISLGKIWHTIGRNPDKFDLVWAPGSSTYANPRSNELADEFREQRRAGVPPEAISPKPPITEMADVPDDTYIDGKTATRAIEELRRVAGAEKPFMLAVGFVRPHLPFASPKKYWDLYDASEIELAANPDTPKGMPRIAFNNNPNFYSYSYGEYPALEEGKPMPPETAQHLRHAYRAATSFVDAQVGRILEELDNLGLASNTIVVLWGDHGFHLGETGQWSKHNNFEWATHSPLIVRAPSMGKPGARTDALVETVDIFPTLLDLCGIPEARIHDGKSFVPLLNNPKLEWKEAVYHLYDRYPKIDGERKLVIGHAVRTKNYRYVTWRMGWELDGEEIASELYDYTEQPIETRNVIDDPDYAEVRRRLIRLLNEGPAAQFARSDNP